MSSLDARQPHNYLPTILTNAPESSTCMVLDYGFLAVGKLLPHGVAAANEMLTQSHLTQNTQR